MAAAGAVLLFACHGEDHSSGGGGGDPAAGVVFEDDFSAGISGAKWVIEEGAPIVDGAKGNGAPGLGLFSPGTTRLHSAATFSTAEQMSVSFDVVMPLENQAGLFFRFAIVREGGLEGPTAFEFIPDTNQVLLTILGHQETVEMPAIGQFHRVTFFVDDSGNATWFLNDVLMMTRSGFPEGFFQIAMEARGGVTTGFVVDNVLVDQEFGIGVPKS
jgi:hypothetical protein